MKGVQLPQRNATTAKEYLNYPHRYRIGRQRNTSICVRTPIAALRTTVLPKVVRYQKSATWPPTPHTMTKNIGTAKSVALPVPLQSNATSQATYPHCIALHLTFTYNLHSVIMSLAVSCITWSEIVLRVSRSTCDRGEEAFIPCVSDSSQEPG